MEEFSLAQVQLYNLTDAQNYISKYFIPLQSGSHAVYMNGKFAIMEQRLVKSTFFNRMSNEINDWYFKKYLTLRTITYELNKEMVYENKLNLCPKLKHTLKPFGEFSEEIKCQVDIMLNYVYEVLANKVQSHYDFLLKWLSNMFKGNKNNSALYLKGEQGIGKSTLFVFIRDYVIGNDLCCETGSEPIKSRFNGILAGKLLVTFEELETFSVNEWIAISSRLKRYITSNKMTVENKNQDAYEANNLNNYVILSNNDAIKDDDGRRYFILDLSNEKKKDTVFWNKVYKCFNDEVGRAFFCKIMEINTDDFNPQDFPITQSKLDAFAKRLEPHEQFIKKEYILKKRSIYCPVDDFCQEFKSFCLDTGFKNCYGKIVLGKKLNELGIKHIKHNGYNYYKVKLDELHAIAEERHWIHDLDEYVKEDEYEAEEEKTSGMKELFDKEITQRDDTIKELADEIEKLKAELEKQKHKKKPSKKLKLVVETDQEEVKENDEIPDEVAEELSPKEQPKNGDKLASSDLDFILANI